MCLSVFVGLCNCGFLVAIATDRYRKVCHMLKPQITMKAAKIITVFIFVFSAIQGSIAILYYGSIQKPTNYPGIYSYSCSAKNYKELNYYQLGFFAFYFLLTMLTFIYLSIVYTIILRKIKVKEGNSIELQQSRKNIRSALYPDEAQRRWSYIPKINDINQLASNSNEELSRIGSPSGVSPEDMSNLGTKNTAPLANKLRETYRERRVREQTERLQRNTVTMLMVTIILIVTYIPSVIAMIVNATLKSEDTMSITAAIFYWLARHTLYINSSFNPIIYSFRHQNFIDEVKYLFGIKHKLKQNRNNSTR
ncbi:uncharacterized protein LOC115217498 [Octopus sinensis]|uniref:Uncharacterized protein LOC115217498 n=1 Tax=Octopus sinensis TaxID=2607531 RepID=A0A6P7SZ46_9MOLL|nr:uncharacterized protein LOC115217498 [Octopus sinensis]